MSPRFFAKDIATREHKQEALDQLKQDGGSRSTQTSLEKQYENEIPKVINSWNAIIYTVMATWNSDSLTKSRDSDD